MNSELVSVIVLTHNNKKQIQKCINSINNQDYENLELIIIDNFSNDGTRQILADMCIDKTDFIKIILNSSNLGYNLGNFEGIKNSTGNYIVILNPDVVLEKSWISNIIHFMKENSEAVIASGKILNEDETIQTKGGHLDIYGAVTQKTDNNDNESFFYHPGAAFIFKKEILTKVELDPNLFMYYDDVDLSWQLRLLGYKINFCEKSISHHNQISEQLPISKFYHISKNRVYVCSKNYSLNRITRRILIIIGFVILDSLYYSFKFKSLKYFFWGLKALGWNIISANTLRISRAKVQKHRIVSDEKIESFMQKNSSEMKFLKSKF